ncbi:MAG: DUF447 family protein [Planctomycetaceae bacterium]|jgi:uncharacterized protein|nr:DUF447 family protein [Planctomycetaceae bacterium]
MILEGIVTTRNTDGTVNVSPMGPEIGDDSVGNKFVLKPFNTSQTYQNLKRSGVGVLHITDDVLLIVRAAIHQLTEIPTIDESCGNHRLVIGNVCRWFEFEVVELDDELQRTRIQCKITQQGELRPFLGFNRAKHAVLEAAILATRVGILERQEIDQQMQHLEVIVEKTAGEQELAAFELVQRFLAATN